MRVPLSQPDITDAEVNEVVAVLRSSQLALGPRTALFEESVAAVAGTRFGVAVSSGTAGLHLLVRALGIGQGDEVITTPFSFIASANCILYERATPVFADVEAHTLNVDPDHVARCITPRTRAILAVDVFGHPAEMRALRTVADANGLPVIEDACEAIGASSDGVPAGAGALCRAGVFAFYPNKQITTGEGGMIVTDDEDLARECRSLRSHGRGDGGPWLRHDRLGYNYRMDELSAALGLAQVRRLAEIMTKRADVAQLYTTRLSRVPGVVTPAVRPGVKMSWFVYVVRLQPGIDRDRVLRYLIEHGVESRPYFPAIHLQPFYRQMFGYAPGDFPVAEAASASTLALPFYNRMSASDVEYVASTLSDALGAVSR